MTDEPSFKTDEVVGHYKILRLLGKGGMSEVYLAEDQNLNRRVALKFLSSSVSGIGSPVLRFEQEARAASGLNHPNILTVHEIFEVGGRRFIATEFVDGQTLRKHLEGGPLGTIDALKIAEQIALALDAAHQSKIIHRDVKPDNVMLRKDGIVKVLDFGIAKLIEQKEIDSEEKTRPFFKTGAGVVLGTANYMSPEQVRSQGLDARTDIFSLGVVIYEMISGHAPFAGETPGDQMAAILNREPPPLSHAVETIPGQLETIVAQAMRKERDERHQTMKELLFDLKALKQKLEMESLTAVSFPRTTVDSESKSMPGPAPTPSSAAVERVSFADSSATRTLVVVGAGPKAAAISAKLNVLTRLGQLTDKPKLELIVIDRGQVATNWRGDGGFTDGKCLLGTPPEKDVGFPYDSRYRSEVDKAMLEYSWQAFKIFLKKTAYSDWVDSGRQQPQHEEWGRYIKWVLDSAQPKALLRGWAVTAVKPAEGKLLIDIASARKHKQIVADGIVFTGPGSPIALPNMPPDTEGLVFNGRDYWKSIPLFRDLQKARVGLIGGGETAASIALSLLDLSVAGRPPVLDIDIINRHGTIFTRGESFRENRIFTNPADWKKLDEPSRLEIIKRTDRGVFSVAAQTKLNQARRVNVRSGVVLGIERAGNKVIVRMRRGDHPAVVRVKYDKVIVALGFDAFDCLKLFPEECRPAFTTNDERLDLQRKVDEFLRVSFDSAAQKPNEELNVHMPMIAGLSQGPGFPNLSCLGHLADSILARYIPPPPPR